jgi:hypothetical protein
MKKKIFNHHSVWHSLSLKIILALLALYFFHFPDHLFHSLLVFFHHVYESLDFIVEEFLIHVLGFNKFYSQMTFFYLSSAAGLYLCYKIWLKIPPIVKEWTEYCQNQIQQIKQYWYFLPLVKKIAYSISVLTLLVIYITFFL